MRLAGHTSPARPPPFGRCAQAVWALGNIAGDSAQFRDLVLEAGAVGPINEILAGHQTAKLSLVRNAAWTMSNLFRGKPQPRMEQVEIALPTLVKLIKEQNDSEVLTDACWAMSYACDGPNDNIQKVLDAGGLAPVMELLASTHAQIQTPALRAVGNVVTGTDVQTQAAIDAGFLGHLPALIVAQKKATRKEAFWAVSNITAGSREQIQAVIDAQLIPPCVTALALEEFDVKKEAAWAIANLTSGGTSEQIHYAVEQGSLKPLALLLDAPDTKMIKISLEAIENILKVWQNVRPRARLSLGPSRRACDDDHRPVQQRTPTGTRNTSPTPASGIAWRCSRNTNTTMCTRRRCSCWKPMRGRPLVTSEMYAGLWSVERPGQHLPMPAGLQEEWQHLRCMLPLS